MRKSIYIVFSIFPFIMMLAAFAVLVKNFLTHKGLLFAIRIFCLISTILCDLRGISFVSCVGKKTHISDILLKEAIIYEIILCLSYKHFFAMSTMKKAVLKCYKKYLKLCPHISIERHSIGPF